MEESGNKLLEFLETPEAYPASPVQVEHIQTHISHVFIAPPFVYKIKKPVNFGFLDFSTLEKRKYFCQREVSLNRRLCSEIYCGVVPITSYEGSYRLGEEEKGTVVEYAVKMNKLEEEYFLNHYIQTDTLTERHLERVAEKLADFYLSQDPSPETLKYGQISRVQYNTDENFKQTESFIGTAIEEADYRALRYFTDSYLNRQADLFKRRVEEKRIVDGHGDLHLEHIHLKPDRICIYDCIEFNERFRYGDQAADLAFLAMDLDYHGCWKEERYFMDLMAEKLNDPELHVITDFYKCYRAYVKGKVKSLQSSEQEVDTEERDRARKTASSYFGLALRYALLGSTPKVLIFMGRVGTGKSTLAEHFSEKLGIDGYSTDRIRKGLAGVPLDQRLPKSQRDALYSKQMSANTYRQLLNKMKQHCEKGESVILDATFSRKQARSSFLNYFKASNIDYLFIEVGASEQRVIQRLKKREKEDKVISDARLEDYHMLQDRYEEPDEIPPSRSISITTDVSITETLGHLYTQLIDWMWVKK